MNSSECIQPAHSPERIYRNDGNLPLIALLGPAVRRVLDVGCGAGDNAALLRARYPECEVHGITFSAAEAQLARRHMSECWVTDVESALPVDLQEKRFDTLLFSHVLEHMREPGAVLQRLCAVLQPGGTVLIAVPNVLSWSMRLQFLTGNFEYQTEGVLDDTHLRFFTYRTADRYLLGRCPQLRLVAKSATGSVPLWGLRRFLLPARWSAGIDALGCRAWPNLFGHQILIKAVREP